MRAALFYFTILVSLVLPSFARADAAATPGTQAVSPALEQKRLAREVTDRDWSVDAKPSLRDKPPSEEALTAFIALQLGMDWTDVRDKGMFSICARNFFDLAHDGKFRLMASTDASGRAICNQLVVASKTGPTQNLNAWDIDEDAKLTSLVHEDNGVTTVVIPELWHATAGMGDCMALWTRIYAWQNGALTDVGTAHRDVYKARLSSLNQEIDAASSANPHDMLEGSCAIMERDRIERFLGGPPETGIEHAEDWMKSDNPSLRGNAIAVLGTIQTDRAKRDLETLGKEPD